VQEREICVSKQRGIADDLFDEETYKQMCSKYFKANPDKRKYAKISVTPAKPSLTPAKSSVASAKTKIWRDEETVALLEFYYDNIDNIGVKKEFPTKLEWEKAAAVRIGNDTTFAHVQNKLKKYTLI